MNVILSTLLVSIRREDPSWASESLLGPGPEDLRGGTQSTRYLALPLLGTRTTLAHTVSKTTPMHRDTRFGTFIAVFIVIVCAADEADTINQITLRYITESDTYNEGVLAFNVE